VPETLNTLIQLIGKRAERKEMADLVNTFVEIGPLFTALSNTENQVVYGRRGTGKTHLLSYLLNTKISEGDLAFIINMNTLGSSGGIYSDNNLPITERASRLLVDFLAQFQDSLTDIVLGSDRTRKFDYDAMCSYLDSFAEAITEVSVDGSIQVLDQKSNSEKEDNSYRFGVEDKTVSFGISNNTGYSSDKVYSTTKSGVETHHIHFGRLNALFGKITTALHNCRIWLLLDEWSELPLDIQPYLADLIRHIIFPCRNIVVKIAAIEQRTNFRVFAGSNDIGIEVGADTDMSVNLDEYMVFDNNSEKAQQFFRQMLYKHLSTVAHEKSESWSLAEADYINAIFTQQNAFSELVRASEGVPRDFIFVISMAAQKADDRLISVDDIRYAAKRWYNTAKARTILSRKNAVLLLRWIVEEVIGKRQARAFLIKSDINDDLINFLFDERVLHIVKDNVSAHDQPGIRFKVYSIDYGCYVDLINTSKFPLGYFQIDSSSDSEIEYIQVPSNDYRSIRRAILDLSTFYNSLSEAP